MQLMKHPIIVVFLCPSQVQLWGGALVYYHPKSLTSRGQERADFKTSPCKLQPLVGQAGKLVLVGPQDAQSQPDVFQVRVYSLVMSSQPLFFYMPTCALFLWVVVALGISSDYLVHQWKVVLSTKLAVFFVFFYTCT